jgi:beta-glucanase (GH16 family)
VPRRNVIRLLAAAATLLGIGGILVPGGSPAGAALRTGAGGAACGTNVLRKADGTAWTCTFDDEFNGTSIDRTKWTVQTTASGGFGAGHACFVDSPRTVTEGDGTLNLTVRRVPEFRCAVPRGTFRTTWYAGSVYTKTFGQAYGRFAIRARFPEASGIRGLQSAIWTYPRDMTVHKAIVGTTEIDIAEAYSMWPDLVNPTVHNFLGGNTKACTVPDFGAAFHTYMVEWTPATASFYYDGTECFWAGRTGTSQPFLVALTQGLGIRADAPTGATPSPATMQVDWVRVWK